MAECGLEKALNVITLSPGWSNAGAVRVFPVKRLVRPPEQTIYDEVCEAVTTAPLQTKNVGESNRLKYEFLRAIGNERIYEINSHLQCNTEHDRRRRCLVGGDIYPLVQALLSTDLLVDMKRRYGRL